MLRKAGYEYWATSTLLFAFLFLATTVTAQQTVPSQKDASSKTNVYLHFTGHSDTFQSTGKAVNYGVNNLYNNLSSKISSLSASSLNEPQKKYSVEGTITFTIDTISTSCGYTNGSIIVTAAGGTSPYTFSITMSGSTYTQNTGNFQNLSAGLYQVTVTDATGTASSATITLLNNFNPPAVSIASYQNPSDCSAFDGGVGLYGSGGTPPYQYSLDNVTYQTSNVFSGLSPGLYYVFVRDANGCIRQSYGDFLHSSNNSCFPVGLSYSYYSCNNNGTITVSGVGDGTGTYQYSLDGINYQDSNVFTNLGAGFYHIYFKDATSPVNVFTVTIFQYCAINITATVTDASCGNSDGQLAILAASGAAPYTYSLDGINFQNNNIFTGLAPGNYTITVKDVNGISVSSTAIIATTCPTVTAITTDEICGQKNGTIISTALSGTAPYQFSIDGINFQSSNTFTGLAAGNYTITVKDAGGFTATTDATVINKCLQIDIALTNVVCGNTNGSITISPINGTAPYQFSIDGTNFQSSNTFTGLAAGNYTISAKDASNAQKDSVVTITDAPSPQASIVTTQASCANTGGSIKINSIGGTAPLQFSIDGTTFQSSNIFNSLDSGIYIGYILDANGCVGKDTAILTALPTPNVFIGNDTSLCQGQALILTAPKGTGNQFQWQDNTTAFSNIISTQGTYYVKVTNQFNCSASDTIIVTYVSLPVFSIGNDSTLCSGESILLKPFPLGGDSYLWSTGETSSSVSATSAGVYWLQVSDRGCTKRDSINVTYVLRPVINLGNDTTLCTGTTIVLNVTNSNSVYTWQDGSAQPTYIVNKAGSYSVNVSRNGCDTTGNILVNYISKPVVQLGSDTVICAGQHLLLNASYAQSTYLWQDGSALSYFDVTQAGRYIVNVANSCGVTNAATVVTEKNCACKFYVPTAFSPDKDGRNDVFKPSYQCLFSNYEMKLYNRFGQLIFASHNPADGWDGSFKNVQQPIGIYVYELTYKDNLTGKVEHLKSSIALLR